jgi:hypothetical protein
VYINVVPAGVKTVSMLAELNVLPNPSTGDFILKGSLGTVSGEDVYVVISDVSGQVILNHTFKAINGVINEQIDLGPEISNGIYIMKIITAGEQKVFHLVLEK